MKTCFAFNGRKICIPFAIEVERQFPPSPPLDLGDLMVDDPAWWHTAATVAAIDRISREVGGGVGVQLQRAATAGLAELQAQLPEGISLELSGCSVNAASV